MPHALVRVVAQRSELACKAHLPELFVSLLQVIGSLFSFVLPGSLPFFLLAGQLKQSVLAFVVLSLCVNVQSSFDSVVLKVRRIVRSSIVTAKDHDFCLCLCIWHDRNVPSSSTAALTKHADSIEQACIWQEQRCMTHKHQLKYDCKSISITALSQRNKRATKQACRAPDLA